MAPVRPPRHRPLKQRRAARHVLAVAVGTCVLAAWVLGRRSTRRVAVLMTATKRRVVAASSEYGELKAAYVYATSVDNKQRYCVVNGCELIVGGDRRETRDRSARWTKVAWLREVLPLYDWVVWTDLDCFFTGTQDVVDLLDATYDVHFTLDSGEEERVNTGFFALRNTQWSRAFLEDVWADNDNGEGLSDQRSFNTILNRLTTIDHTTHVKLYSKSILNAFPALTNYIATEDYEPPTTAGDETLDSRVIHYAGQFGGARNSDGATPPTMLVQFLDLLLERHAAFLETLPAINHPRLRSVGDAARLVAGARSSLKACLKALRTYRPGAQRTPVAALAVFEPAAQTCDADAALLGARAPLSELIVPGEGYAASLLCSHSNGGITTTAALTDAFPVSVKVGFRAGHKQVHVVANELVVVAHECASLRGQRVVDDGTSLILADGSGDEAGPSISMPRLAVLVAGPADDFWTSVAPRALACLKAAGAPLLVVVGRATHGEDWARLGVALEMSMNVDATELYTCHGGLNEGASLVRDRLGEQLDAGLWEESVYVVTVESTFVKEVKRLLPDARVVELEGTPPWDGVAGALDASRALIVSHDTSAALRCHPGTLLLEVGTQTAKGLASDLVLGYRAVADVGEAAEAFHAALEASKREVWTDRDEVGGFLDSLGLKGDAVEVGSAFGDFSTRILKWTGLKTLYAVDSYRGAYAARKSVMEDTLRGALKHRKVIHIEQDSLQVSSFFGRRRLRELYFVYLDGDKDRIAEDLQEWYPQLRRGGVLAGHDAGQSRVIDAVRAFLAKVEPAPTLRLTDAQTTRLDVRGVEVPACCPTWYFRKPGVI